MSSEPSIINATTGAPTPKPEQNSRIDAAVAQQPEQNFGTTQSRGWSFFKDTSEQWIALGTWVLALGTWVLALVTIFLVVDTDHASKKQLRAYVSAKIIKPVTDFAPNSTAKVQISLQNSGQTPAVDLMQIGILYPRPFPLPEDMDLTVPQPNTRGSTITLHPRDNENGTIYSYKVDPPIYDALRLGQDARLYTFGQVDYWDIFGARHWTHFCYYFDPGNGPTLSQWETCSRYNDTDKN
jgi:hypothetical protein